MLYAAVNLSSNAIIHVVVVGHRGEKGCCMSL